MQVRTIVAQAARSRNRLQAQLDELAHQSATLQMQLQATRTRRAEQVCLPLMTLDEVPR